jgi:hypothetical protein
MVLNFSFRTKIFSPLNRGPTVLSRQDFLHAVRCYLTPRFSLMQVINERPYIIHQEHTFRFLVGKNMDYNTCSDDTDIDAGR